MNLHRAVLNTQHILAHKLYDKESVTYLKGVRLRGRWKADREVCSSMSLAEGPGDTNLAEGPQSDYLYPPAKVPGA